MNNGFAVIDFETTGLHPEQGDRAIQLAIITTDHAGEIQNKWVSYINPEGKRSHPDAARTHRINNRILHNSPKFKELYPIILNKILNRTLVAHSIDFDMSFLILETERSGLKLPQLKTFCTKAHAFQALPQLTSSSLQSCLQAIHKTNHHPHDALSDAEATLELLKYYLKANPELINR